MRRVLPELSFSATKFFTSESLRNISGVTSFP